MALFLSNQTRTRRSEDRVKEQMWKGASVPNGETTQETSLVYRAAFGGSNGRVDKPFFLFIRAFFYDELKLSTHMWITKLFAFKTNR